MRRSRFLTALRNIFRNALMSFASIVSVAFTLIMLGMVLLLLINAEYATEKVGERFDTMRYLIPETADEAEMSRIEGEISAIDNVTMVVLVPKDEAWAQTMEDFGEDASAFEGMDNPLPNVFEIQISDIEQADATLQAIENIDPDDNVRYDRDVADIITNFARVIRIAGTVLVGALLFITILSIVNTIRVGISSRQSEITIMRYVGATRQYIRGPFLIEGAILGLVGAGLSAVTLYYSYHEVQLLVQRYLSRMSNEIMITDQRLLWQIMILNLVIGVCVGFLGSLYSMRKHLKV